MSRLRQAAEDYVSIRRALGFKLDRHPRLLAQFVAYLEEAGASTVTTGLALAWATIPAGTSPDWHRARLSVARGFAAYLAALDPGTQVPAADLLCRGDQRATPYLLSEDALASLVAAAGALAPPLRAATYGTLFGLLAAACASGRPSGSAAMMSTRLQGFSWSATRNGISPVSSRWTPARSAP